MTRMRIDLGGQHNGVTSFGHPYQVLWWLVILKCILAFSQGFIEGAAADGGTLPDWYPSFVIACNVLNWILVPYIIFLTYRAYVIVQEKYKIRNEGSSLCDVICCRPCATARMLRHTADHNRYPYVMCEERGLPEYAPAVV